MNHYIFLTHEGNTYQPNSKAIEPDIENLQVIGTASGRNPKEAFKNLILQNKYLKETTFEEIFCYRLDNNYKDSYMEFNIKEDYETLNEEIELIQRIESHMGLDEEDAPEMLQVLKSITKGDLHLVRKILCEEKFCNYYHDTHSYYELSANLVNDDVLWEIDGYDDFYNFLLKCDDEDILREKLQSGGWHIKNGFAICLDDEI